MSFTGTVKNDTIELPPGVHLPDGTQMTVEPAEASPAPPALGRTFAERNAKYIGICKDGPTDLALNHDHYLYGAPKRDV